MWRCKLKRTNLDGPDYTDRRVSGLGEGRESVFYSLRDCGDGKLVLSRKVEGEGEPVLVVVSVLIRLTGFGEETKSPGVSVGPRSLDDSA